MQSARFTDVLVSFGATQCVIRFQVLPCPVATILGVPFFKTMNLQVNWEKPEVLCYKKSRKIIFELTGVSKTKPEVELSSLTSFIKGLKKKYYTSAAMVFVTEDQP